MDIQIQEKIASLLRLAANNTNLNEANVAMAQAMKLAEKYRIEIAAINLDAEAETVEAVEKDFSPFISGGRIRNWKIYLLQAIVKAQGCACYSFRNARSHYGETSYYVYGRPTDISIARSMYNWALSELEFIGTLACKGKGKVYANSWYTGAVAGITTALDKGKEAAREGVSVTALAIVDERVKESDKVMRAEMKLKNRPFAKSSHIDGEAYCAGRVVGSRMTFGKNLLK
jgi:hypothetical protein